MSGLATMGEDGREFIVFDGTASSANTILAWIGGWGGKARRRDVQDPEKGIVINNPLFLHNFVVLPGDRVVQDPGSGFVSERRVY